MARSNRLLAEALRALHALQDRNEGVVRSSELSPAQRTLLAKEGFIRPVIKGWYLMANPHDADGDSTSWYAGFRPFLRAYLASRFGTSYCLNAEASLLLHTRSPLVPRQVTVLATEGGSSVIELPFGCSIVIYSDKKNFPAARTELLGLQALTLPATLLKLMPRSFTTHPRDAQIALGMLTDISGLLSLLLDRQAPIRAAGRVAGALRHMGRKDDAERLVRTLQLAGMSVRPTDPFDEILPVHGTGRSRSPYSQRLTSMWAGWREEVLAAFPPAPGLPADAGAYLDDLDERYSVDAYNSLSIEGYRVSRELIERIAEEGWNPDGDRRDAEDRDALAARGYFQAFRAVREDIRLILEGGDAAPLITTAHHRWHAELFAPAVRAGILEAHQLAGYRSGPVYIRNSRHTPLPADALVDAMETLFTLIGEENEPSVRAVLGHHLFVFIHPYFDGNGRLGRFLLNALLASGGYRWTVVRMERRRAYMAALEEASAKGRIGALARFLAEEMAAG